MIQSKPTKINWIEVVVFYIIACAFSWPFFYWRDVFSESWANSTIPKPILNLCVMWGPGVAAIICFLIFRKTHIRSISIVGSSILKSLLFFLLPYLVWLIVLFFNPDESTLKPLDLMMVIPFGFIMILGEELGWRGFLQDTLAPLKEWKKWLILGLMWEFWHFTRGIVEGELHQIIIRKSLMILSCLVLTYIIGKLTVKTKSLLVAITIHSWANIAFEFSHLNTYITGIISLLIWFVLIWKWDKADDLRASINRA
jgi:hypothetical protein